MPELPGPYQSQLVSEQYQALIDLVQQNLAAGEYGGGRYFDTSAAQALQAQGKDFASLPTLSAGTRAQADSVNYPLSLLAVRFQAIASEKEKFITAMQQLLTVLEQDSSFVEHLIYAVGLRSWAALCPQLTSAQTFSYDLAATHGPVNIDVDQTDPVSGAAPIDSQGNLLAPSAVAFGEQTSFLYGLGTPGGAISAGTPLRLSWNVTNSQVVLQQEILSDKDWTSLSLLYAQPAVHTLTPQSTVLLPSSQSGTQVVKIRGISSLGTLPVYVQIGFNARQKVVILAVTNANQVFSLSANRISADAVLVFDDQAGYFVDTDYRIDLANGNRNFIALASLVGKTITVIFNEYVPGYECSIDNKTWSPWLFFDTENPFLDPANTYFPVEVSDGWFPVLDELGNALGLEIQPSQTLTQNYLLRLQAPGVSPYGAQATLEIDLANPGYWNALHLEPFTEMPVRLTQVIAQGLETNQNTIVFTGDLLLDRAMSVRFANPDSTDVFATKLFLTLVQENYTWEQVAVPSPDQLRKQTLASLQTMIPFSPVPVNGALPVVETGVEYNFGLRSLQAERWQFDNSGVIVFGPFTVTGSPELLRVDQVLAGGATLYLLYELTDTQGKAWGVTTPGVAIPANGTISFPDLVTLPNGFSGAITQVDFYLKWGMAAANTVLSRFLLQVTTS